MLDSLGEEEKQYKGFSYLVSGTIGSYKLTIKGKPCDGVFRTIKKAESYVRAEITRLISEGLIA